MPEPPIHLKAASGESGFTLNFPQQSFMYKLKKLPNPLFLIQINKSDCEKTAP